MNFNNLAFFVSCFGVRRPENKLSNKINYKIIYGGYSLITLNKLKSVITNYSKFMKSSLAVSNKTSIYGGYSLADHFKQTELSATTNNSKFMRSRLAV